MEISGSTLLEHICGLGSVSGFRVTVIGCDRPEKWSAFLDGVSFHRDERPGFGPLGGLCTALSLAGEHSVIAVAADMPAIDGAALDWLHSLDAAPATVRARIPRHDHGLEPLCALYRPSLLPALSARLDRGDLAVHSLVEESGVETVAAPDWLRPRLVNINTPADWDGFTTAAETR